MKLEGLTLGFTDTDEELKLVGNFIDWWLVGVYFSDAEKEIRQSLKSFFKNLHGSNKQRNI